MLALSTLVLPAAAEEEALEPRLGWAPNRGAAQAHAVAAIAPGPVTGFGGGLDVMAVWSPLLLSVGGGLTWSSIDKPDPTHVSTDPDVALPPLDVDVEDRRLELHTVVRLTAPRGWLLRPYAEALAAAIRWSSVYTLRFASGGDAAEVSSDVQWSTGLGWGLGFLIQAGPKAGSYFALGFRRQSEGRQVVERELDTSNVVDTFPRGVYTLLLGGALEP